MAEVLARVLDATDATVGGGSAAALAGAMAAGLAGMVARLSVGRGLELSDARYTGCAVEADVLGSALLAGAGDDAEAYGLVKAAYGLPRESVAQVEAREAAIGDALIAAALVPLDNARRALRVREICRELAGRSNAAAASDLGVAVRLADAAVGGCLLNVEVNLDALPGSPAAARLRREAEAVRIGHARTSAPLKERV
jgi:formiminotetrahydrofolate cyclodeaminase